MPRPRRPFFMQSSKVAPTQKGTFIVAGERRFLFLFLGMVQARVTLPVEPSVPCQDEWHSGPVGLLPRKDVI